MKLQLKLLLSFGLVLIVTFAGIELLGYQQARKRIALELRQNAREIRHILMAVRRVYHYQFIDSGVSLSDKTLGFLPAHALSRISSDFLNWSNSGLTFNNVSDRPRNLGNQADDLELQAMAYFRENPGEKERMTYFKNKQGDNFYHFTAPIFVEKYCLKCHGASEEAPDEISKAYYTSFDYKLGELRGVMSIKLPVSLVLQDIIDARLQMAGKHLFGFLLVFFFGGWLLNRLVIKRLTSLNSAVGEIAVGNYTVPIPVTSRDELGDLAAAFKHMVEKRQQTEMDLRLERNNLLNILDCMEDGIYIVNGQFDIQYVNPVVENGLGSFEGVKCYKYLYGLDNVCPWCKFQEIKAGKAVQWEWFSEKDGKTYDLLDTPIKLADGSQGKLDFFRDITERKKIEEELKLYHAKLETLIKERTTELESKNASLEKMNELFADREFRIKDLKERIRVLEAEKNSKQQS